MSLPKSHPKPKTPSNTSPPVDPSLPAPNGSLYQVVLGRGTQNYTCDKSNATAVPSPTGANATLFNVTCIAASMPDLLSVLPDIALNLPTPNPSSPSLDSHILQTLLVGTHYFADLSTPLFNLTTSIHDYGMGTFKKTDATPAPEGAMAGVQGQEFGAVAWLRLDANPSSYVPQQRLREVYRMNTAGGSPPEDCSEAPEAFEIEYAAEYWFYS